MVKVNKSLKTFQGVSGLAITRAMHMKWPIGVPGVKTLRDTTDLSGTEWGEAVCLHNEGGGAGNAGLFSALEWLMNFSILGRKAEMKMIVKLCPNQSLKPKVSSADQPHWEQEVTIRLLGQAKDRLQLGAASVKNAMYACRGNLR
jgi:hypothetical protein